MRHLQPGHASNYRLSGLIVIISERIVPKHDKNGRIRTRNLSPNTALASGAVEAGIRPLVEALNSSGHCHTIASCHGHGEVLGGAWISVPYTLFRSSLDFARAFLLHRLHGSTWHETEAHLKVLSITTSAWKGLTAAISA